MHVRCAYDARIARTIWTHWCAVGKQYCVQCCILWRASDAQVWCLGDALWHLGESLASDLISSKLNWDRIWENRIDLLVSLPQSFCFVNEIQLNQLFHFSCVDLWLSKLQPFTCCLAIFGEQTSGSWHALKCHRLAERRAMLEVMVESELPALWSASVDIAALSRTHPVLGLFLELHWQAGIPTSLGQEESQTVQLVGCAKSASLYLVSSVWDV